MNAYTVHSNSREGKYIMRETQFHEENILAHV